MLGVMVREPATDDVTNLPEVMKKPFVVVKLYGAQITISFSKILTKKKAKCVGMPFKCFNRL
jgi:hypothetical protein